MVLTKHLWQLAKICMCVSVGLLAEALYYIFER